MDFAALQHSVFLHALGSAILNSLWQCFILLLVYEIISASYKSASARFKNNLSTLLLFFSFVWFLTSFISRIFGQENTTPVAAMPNGLAIEAQPGIHVVSGFSTFLSYASAALPYLSVAYIFLLCFLISRLFAAYRYVYFISNKRLIHPTAELQHFTAKVAREIGITKKISVWISHHIDVPATIGFIKPVILIPLASINNLSGNQLEAIILHELAHIRRNDYVTNLIISVIETILFFNPFVVLLSNIIKRERENCCDDFVLQYRYDPHAYASALLRLEQSRMSKLQLAIGAVSGKKQLLSRIKRITNSQVASRQFNYGQKLVALLLVTGIICSVAWLSPEEKKSAPTKVWAKKLKTAPLSKIRSAVKAPQPAEVIINSRPVDNLTVMGIKPVSPKTEPAALPETGIDDLFQGNSSDEMGTDDNNDDKKDNAELSSEDNNTYPEHINVKPKPRFFFSENNFKIPPFINIQNFPLQNMALNIDLSKIDMKTLNANLKLVYKQINTLNWNEVQHEIRKSFSKVKISGFSQKEREAFYGDKAKALAQLTSIYAQQQNDSKAVLEQLKKVASQQDILRAAKEKLRDDDNIKIRKTYKKEQRDRERNADDNNYYYYDYANSNNTTVANTGKPFIADTDNDDDDNAAAACPSKEKTPDTGKKTVHISIKRSPGHSAALNEKKALQFSFSSDDEKSNTDNVISVELTDTP